MDNREAIARRLEAELGTLPPDVLLDIWTTKIPINLAADTEVRLYGPEEIAERNVTYEISEYRPDLLLIGDDGGGQGLLVTRDEPDPEVYLIGTGAIGSYDGVHLGRLTEFAATGFRLIDDEGPRGNELLPGDLVDVVLTRRPPAGVRALFEIRKRLGLSVPISRLVDKDAAFPMLLLENVYYSSKIAEEILKINLDDECIVARRHSHAP